MLPATRTACPCRASASQRRTKQTSRTQERRTAEACSRILLTLRLYARCGQIRASPRAWLLPQSRRVSANRLFCRGPCGLRDLLWYARPAGPDGALGWFVAGSASNSEKSAATASRWIRVFRLRVPLLFFLLLASLAEIAPTCRPETAEVTAVLPVR